MVLDMLLLIALGIGYLVFYFANREEKFLRLLGYFIGTLILTAALAYMFGGLLLQKQFYSRGRYYQKAMQPAPMMPRRTK